MKQNILLINRGSGNNLGDQAIKYSLVNLIEGLGNKVFFKDYVEYKPTNKFPNNFDSYRKKDKKQNILINKLSNIIPKRLIWYFNNRKLFEIDSLGVIPDQVIIGGGQLINNNKLFSIALYIWILMST